jgi:hypothetical protein
MQRWLSRALTRIRTCAIERKVLFTLKARRELASWDLDEEDACDIMASLRAADSTGRIRSATTHEWMYLFKPQHTETTLYLKLILRSDCIVISFHGDEDDQEEI